MKLLSKEKSKMLAEENGWTIARAQGYVDGEQARRRGTVPSKLLLVGIDDYCAGFRAGYFAAARTQSKSKAASR